MYEGLSPALWAIDDVLEILAGCPELAAAAQEAQQDDEG